MNFSGLNNILPLINILGLLTLGGAIVFTQWRLGLNRTAEEGTRVSREVIDAYKEQVSQLREELDKERDLRTTLSNQVATLQAEGVERQKKIEELTLLLTGKSPDQEKYMIEMRALAATATAFIKRSDDREDIIVKLLSKKVV